MRHRSAFAALEHFMQPAPASFRFARHLNAAVAAAVSVFVACGGSSGPCSQSANAQQPVAVRPASIAQPIEPIPLPAGRAESLAPPGFSPAPDQSTPPALGAQVSPPAMEPSPEAEVLTLGDLEQIALMNNPSLGR